MMRVVQWVLPALAFAATAPAAACTIGKIGDIPITMRGLSPETTATINGEERRFVVDSGAFFSTLAPSAASELGLALSPAPADLEVSGIGGSVAVKIAKVRQFVLLEHKFANIEFIVGGSEFGATGLIGQNLLGGDDVEYDLAHGIVHLMRSHDCAKANLAYWVKPGEAYSILQIGNLRDTGYHTEGKIAVNDVPVRATFDTGAPLSTLSLAAAARAGLKPNMPGAQPGGAFSGIGRRTQQSWIVPVRVLRLGDEEIRNARIRIGDLVGDIEMLIGADFFISHRVYVSNANRRIYLSYVGGPVFDLRAHSGNDLVPSNADMSAESAGQQADAETLAREASVAAARHDGDRAIADLGRAIALAPSEPRYRLARARLLANRKDNAGALADLDKALAVDSGNVGARIARAALYVDAKRNADAIADLDVADAKLSEAADERLDLSGWYESADALPKAISQAGRWLAVHPVDVRRPDALNSRCWFRTLANIDLKQAVGDCNAALKLRAGDPGTLDSRGLLHVRLGEPAKAIVDYDAALAKSPGVAWSYLGRGLAHKALGEAADAKADRDAAIKIEPDIVERARRYGFDL